MKSKTLSLFAILLFSSCCGHREITQEERKTDSVNMEVRERVVTIHDTAFFEVPIEKIVNVAEQNSHLATKFAISDAFIDSCGLLHHTIENIPQKVEIPHTAYVTASDTTKRESHEQTKTITEYREVQKPLTWYQNFFIGMGVAATIYVLIMIVVMIVKFATKC